MKLPKINHQHQEPFPWRLAFLASLGIFPLYVMEPIVNLFLPIFLQAGHPLWEESLRNAGQPIPQVVGFGLPPTLAFFIMTWDNILNLFIAPWVGARSDSSVKRLGAVGVESRGWCWGQPLRWSAVTPEQ
ncbi:MAG: hypothetical protein AAF639_38990 [Chloroflexota bacterium]